ncbi:MAG: hypothetical protein GKR92_05425 [Gammaproteobacteria bacterium]|nr:MAG: hypothetical protein GKR92_05425 [Gammaproteobacteria bacterium]
MQILRLENTSSNATVTINAGITFTLTTTQPDFLVIKNNKTAYMGKNVAKK